MKDKIVTIIDYVNKLLAVMLSVYFMATLIYKNQYVSISIDVLMLGIMISIYLDYLIYIFGNFKENVLINKVIRGCMWAVAICVCNRKGFLFWGIILLIFWFYISNKKRKSFDMPVTILTTCIFMEFISIIDIFFDGQYRYLSKAFNNSLGVDIVFVIDVTKSMERMIDIIQTAAISFLDEFFEKMNSMKRRVENLRVKVISFRDFYYDGNHAYNESKFFTMPNEKMDLKEYLNEIYADGGGDDPESGLEALAMAMKSDFVQKGEKKRHIIILFTDAAAHPFEDYDKLTAEAARKGYKPTIYPENMPKDIYELYNVWEGNTEDFSKEVTTLDKTGRRLVLFAPNEYPWADMGIDLSSTIRYDLSAIKSVDDIAEVMEFLYHAI